MTKEERLVYQRQRRKLTGNQATLKYEKTVNGFLMRLYRNMKSRIQGVQKQKAHLYCGKELLDKEVFYSWAKDSPEFKVLWEKWVASDHEQKLAPSVDRKDSEVGYVLGNMEWVTQSENSRRGAVSQKRKCNENFVAGY
jgi:hypothetical protein